MNAITRNAHMLLRAAFFAAYEDLTGHSNDHCGFNYSYQLSDAEAVDWLQQLMNGDVVLDLHLDDNGCYHPALGA